MVVLAQVRSFGAAPSVASASTPSCRRLSQPVTFFGSGLSGVHRQQARDRKTGTVLSASATAAPSTDIQRLGPDLWNTSYYPTGQDAAALYKDWFIVDVEGQTLGRMAVLIANYIRGKNLPTYTPSMDMGAFVVVINAEKVTVSGNKFNAKLYKRHTTGRPGSMKTETFKDLQQRIPERIIEKAVKGMLPRGKLGNALFRHLKVYKGASHPHTAQQPVDITSQINSPRPSNATA